MKPKPKSLSKSIDFFSQLIMLTTNSKQALFQFLNDYKFKQLNYCSLLNPGLLDLKPALTDAFEDNIEAFIRKILAEMLERV